MHEIAAGPRLRGLDTLRAFAVLMVVLYHLTIFGELPAALLPVTACGWMGVDLFFVLSGFLIGGQILKPYANGQRPSVLHFYRRRAYRILPSYLVVLALYVLLPRWREAPRLPPLWKMLTFTMNLGFAFDRRAFSHAWSLCVEEHFYLLLPLAVAGLMIRPSMRKAVFVLAGLVLFEIALRALLITHYPDEVHTRIYYPTYTRLDGLLVGVSLACVRTFRPAWWHELMKRGHSLLLAGVVCVGGVVWVFRDGDEGDFVKWGVVFGYFLLAAGLGLITASSVSHNGLLARVEIPGAEHLAALAFTLYLVHKPVAHAVMERLPRDTASQGPLSWLLYATSCVLASALLHLFVERPFLRLRDRGTRQTRTPQLEAEMRREPAL